MEPRGLLTHSHASYPQPAKSSRQFHSIFYGFISNLPSHFTRLSIGQFASGVTITTVYSHHPHTHYLPLSISSVFILSLQYLANITNYEAPHQILLFIHHSLPLSWVQMFFLSLFSQTTLIIFTYDERIFMLIQNK